MRYITTVTGKHFDPMNPQQQEIDIVDIAHALSMLCRANGHFKRFYSVAQHCIACANEASERGASLIVTLGSLLHDASEAYLSDVTRPVKKELPLYQQAEDALQGLIYRRFIGRPLTDSEKAQISEIDDDMLSMEFHQLMCEELNKDHQKIISNVICEVRPVQTVRNDFLQYFISLFDDFSIHRADKEQYPRALSVLPPDANPPSVKEELWIMELEDEMIACGYYGKTADSVFTHFLSDDHEKIYHPFLRSAIRSVPETLTDTFDKLTDCDGKTVMLTTVWDEVFFGIASHLSRDYCFHEFGTEKEGIQIGMYVFYFEDIKSIAKWSVFDTLI